MSVNMKKKEFTVKEVVCAAFGETKAECDVIVPDIKPDISKVLYVCARPYITQKTVQQDKAYIRGVASATVVYIPEGGGIKSLCAEIDFSHIIEAKGAKEGNCIFAEAVCEKTEYSLINSRKINIKCAIGIDMKICEIKNMQIPEEIENNGSIQMKRHDMKFMCMGAEREVDFSVNERIEIPSGKSDIEEIITSEIRRVSGETRENKLCGEMRVAITYISGEENGMLQSVEETFPFEAELPFTSEGLCDISYIVKDICTELDEDPSGAERIVRLSANMTAVIRECEKCDFNIISDAFGLEKELVLTKNEYRTETVAARETTQISHKEEIDIPEYLPPIARICDVSSSVRLCEILIEDGRVTISAEADTNIIYESEGEVSGFSHISRFSQTIDVTAAKADSICEAKAELDHIGYNITSDTEMELRFTVNASVTLLKDEIIDVIEEIDTAECEEEEKKSAAVIYFPHDGEEIWEVAKKYRVAPERIREENNLEDETLCKGQKICIFR